MATSRRAATNENISTYDSGGGQDYTALATWEAATDIDLVTATQSEVLECYAGSHDDEVVIDGATTNTSYFRIIRPASGEGHDGYPHQDGSAAYFVTTTSDINMFQMVEDNCQIQDLVMSLNQDGGSAYCASQTGNNQHLIGCLSINPVNIGGDSKGFRENGGSGDTMYFINCIAIGCDDAAYQFDSGISYVYNCHAIDSGEGFNESGGDVICKNCLGNGTTVSSDFDGSYNAASDYNSSGDGSAPGTNSRINQTFAFSDSGNDDFRLGFTDGGARNFGTDLSADGNFAFDDDIADGVMGAGKAGLTRPQESVWDIGFHERTTSSSSSSSSS